MATASTQMAASSVSVCRAFTILATALIASTTTSVRRRACVRMEFVSTLMELSSANAMMDSLWQTRDSVASTSMSAWKTRKSA